MKFNKKVFDKLSKIIGSESGVYSAIRRKETFFKGAVKSNLLFWVVASDYGVKASKYIKDETILSKIDDLIQRMNLGSSVNNGSKVRDNTESGSPRQEIDPFLIPLSKYNLDILLSRECKVRKPYHKEINHAILNLEISMREKMNLDDTYYGIRLVDHANKLGVFKRINPSEQEGLLFLFRAAILWLRNSGSHKKRGATKEDCLQIILFTDYLIRLFSDLYDKNISKNSV